MKYVHVKRTKRKRTSSVFAKRCLWKTDEHKCTYCDCELTFTEATVDHFVPLCEGGKTTESNEYLCCNRCNGIKGGEWFSTIGEARKFIAERTISVLAAAPSAAPGSS